MDWKITYEPGCPTIAFAAQELSRYLRQMDPGGNYSLLKGLRQTGGGLQLGLAAGLGVALPEVANPELDDAIGIQLEKGCGFICGSNPRSVLIGVYRFLRELGCMWPTPAAEIIPPLPAALPELSIREAASYRHRGVTIEGAVSGMHVERIIDWLPKNGFNGYFIQFMVPYTFYERWYHHTGNPMMAQQTVDEDQVMAMTEAQLEQIALRGLMFHGVGHGWTCEPFGIAGNAWEADPSPLPEEVRPYLALVDGQRALHKGVALNTNLCYANAEVQARMTDAIVDYCQAHPQLDYLHFWLADDSNNHCTCPACVQSLPADLYVDMLNLLDEKLTAAGLPTRVVFLLYEDLLWAPERARIAHPDRFALMFAPITRTYAHAFTEDVRGQLPATAPYRRNQNTMPQSVEENLAYLQKWQAQFDGDSFIFDYHMMWAHLSDPGYSMIAHVVFEDMRGLESLGLNGSVSCQLQRAFFPTGLPMYLMAQALWNRQGSESALTGEFFQRCYGPDGPKAQAYLRTLSERFDPARMMAGGDALREEAYARQLGAISQIIQSFRPVIESNCTHKDLLPGQRHLWQVLKAHATYARAYAKLVQTYAQGQDTAKELQQLLNIARKHEAWLNAELDVFEIVRTLTGRFGAGSRKES